MPSCVSFLFLIQDTVADLCVSLTVYLFILFYFIFFSFLFMGVLNRLHRETKPVFKSSVSNTPINCLKITDNFYKLF
jgi:peptidoglycan biosynthesis protein MviN/MurJ (putative lipid II flippase)